MEVFIANSVCGEGACRWLSPLEHEHEGHQTIIYVDRIQHTQNENGLSLTY